MTWCELWQIPLSQHTPKASECLFSPLSVPQDAHSCHIAVLNPCAGPLSHSAKDFPALCDIPTVLLGLCILVCGCHAGTLRDEHMLGWDLGWFRWWWSPWTLFSLCLDEAQACPAPINPMHKVVFLYSNRFSLGLGAGLLSFLGQKRKIFGFFVVSGYW